MSSTPQSMNWLERRALNIVKGWSDREVYRLKKTRQQIPDLAGTREPIATIPRFNQAELLNISKNHWLIRTIVRIRVEDIISAGGDIEPRYRKKCKKCGKEYQTSDVDKCDVAGCDGKEFVEPAIEQYRDFTALVRTPSPQKDWDTFVRSTLHYGLALDEFHWEIAQVKTYDPETGKYGRQSAKEIRVLDSSTIKPIINAYGDLGGHEWFCPLCYEDAYIENGVDEFVDIRQYTQAKQPIPPCKRCGGELQPTAYVQDIKGRIVARWTKDEIVRDTPNSIDPEWFGLSCIVPAIKHLYIIDFMDSYNLQVYSQGDVGSVVVFPDTDDAEVQELRTKLDNQLRQRIYRDVITGKSEPTLQILTAMIGIKAGKEPKRIALMETLDKLQSIDYYSLYVEKVCGVFGVIPTFSQAAQQGDSKRLNITYMVPNATTRASMKNFEEAFNNKLLPKLGITDWVWKFGKVESKDLLREAQIKQTNIMAVSVAIGAGFDVEMEPDGSGYTLSARPVNPPESRSRLEAGKIPQDQDGAPKRTMPSGSKDGVPIPEPEDDEKE